MSGPSEPTFHRDDDGFLTLELPDNPAPMYPVATPLFQQWCDDLNELNAYRRRDVTKAALSLMESVGIPLPETEEPK